MHQYRGMYRIKSSNHHVSVLAVKLNYLLGIYRARNQGIEMKKSDSRNNLCIVGQEEVVCVRSHLNADELDLICHIRIIST